MLQYVRKKIFFLEASDICVDLLLAMLIYELEDNHKKDIHFQPLTIMIKATFYYFNSIHFKNCFIINV